MGSRGAAGMCQTFSLHGGATFPDQSCQRTWPSAASRLQFANSQSAGTARSLARWGEDHIWPSAQGVTDSASRAAPASVGRKATVQTRSPPGDASPAPRQATGAGDAATDRLRGMLLEVGSSFIGFEKAVEDGARRMRLQRSEQVDEVQASLRRIEQALATEIQSRATWGKTIREEVETSLNRMRSSLYSRLSERSQQLAQSLDSLGQRCAMLERGIQQFKGEVPSKLQVDTTALWQDARKLQTNLDTASAQCLEKDSELLQEIAEADHSVDFHIAQELFQLERQLQVLQQEFEDFTSHDESRRSDLEGRIVSDLDSIGRGIASETSCREQADDDLVQAINRYTTSLHRAIQAAST